MCGIAGYIGRKQINLKFIKQTLDMMKNRGPDARKYANIDGKKNNIVFLHSRLSIIDLKTRSNQPFKYKNLTMIFNGEIYNYLELRKLLEKKSYNFETNSDTEVLIKLIHYFGNNAFKLLEGMWALAIYNNDTNELILSRDRFGEKPLYILKQSDGIFFGSETKFIESLSNSLQKPNLSKCSSFLNYGYNSVFNDNKTFKKNIKTLDPAELFFINEKLNLSSAKYWQINTNQETKLKINEVFEKINELITSSLKIRLRSDVKNVFCLSGGIDSGSLVSIAKKKFNQTVDTFSIIDQQSTKYNELTLIEHTLKDTKSKKNFVYTENIKFFDTLKRVVGYYNSPILTVNYLLHAIMLEKIKEKGFKVVLSGNGADEIFAGYYDHYLFHLADLRQYFSNLEFKKNYISWKKNLLPILRNKNYKNFEKYFKNRDKQFFLNINFNKMLKKDSNNFIPIKFNGFQSYLKNNMINQLPERLSPILFMDDLNSMMSSVENRTPFLDSKLVEFMFSLPSNIFIKNGFSKYLLRKSMKNILNEKIRTARRKYGFNASLQSFKDFNKKSYIENIFDHEKNIKNLININLFYKYVNSINFTDMNDEESKFLFRVASVTCFLSCNQNRKS